MRFARANVLDDAALVVDLPPVPDLDDLDPHGALGKPLDLLDEFGRSRELRDLLVLQCEHNGLLRRRPARFVA